MRGGHLRKQNRRKETKILNMFGVSYVVRALAISLSVPNKRTNTKVKDHNLVSTISHEPMTTQSILLEKGIYLIFQSLQR